MGIGPNDPDIMNGSGVLLGAVLSQGVNPDVGMDCGTLNVVCQVQTTVASMLGGIVSSFVNMATGAVETMAVGAGPTVNQLQATATLSTSLWANLTVLFVVLTFIIQLAVAGWNLSWSLALGALARAATVGVLFRFGLWIMLDDTWGVIPLVDSITKGIVTGLGLDADSMTASILHVVGLDTGSKITWVGVLGATSGPGVINGLSGLVMSAGILWVVAVFSQVMSSLRLLAVLLLVVLMPLVLVAFPTSRGTQLVRSYGMTMLALLLSQPLTAIILAAGFRLFSASAVGFDFPKMVATSLIIGLASLSPFFALKMFAWAGLLQAASSGDGGTHDHMQGQGRGASRGARRVATTVLTRGIGR